MRILRLPSRQRTAQIWLPKVGASGPEWLYDSAASLRRLASSRWLGRVLSLSWLPA